MDEQFITFETAKLAKAKGFDVECLYVYNPNGVLISKWYECTAEIECVTGDMILNQFKIRHDFYKAPTQSLLQKWLREVHEIEIEVWREVNFSSESYYNTYSVNVSNTKLTFPVGESLSVNHINIYESALEQGLVNALNLIEV